LSRYDPVSLFDQKEKKKKIRVIAGELIADIVIKINGRIETTGYCISSFLIGLNPNGYFISF